MMLEPESFLVRRSIIHRHRQRDRVFQRFHSKKCRKSVDSVCFGRRRGPCFGVPLCSA